MQNQEIAEELFASVNTVKTQLSSIYRKLGVAERNTAIAGAEQLGLIERCERSPRCPAAIGGS